MSHYLGQIPSWLGSFTNPTWDVVVILTLIAAGFFYGISAGRVRIAAIIIYTYVAYALLVAFPIDKLSGPLGQEIFLIRIEAFSLIFLLLVWLLGSSKRRERPTGKIWWHIFLLSFLQTGFLAHIVFGFLPQDTLNGLAPAVRALFANPDYTIWWFVTPITVLILLKRFE